MRYNDPIECNCAYTAKDVEDFKSRISQLECMAGLKAAPFKSLIFPGFQEAKLKPRQSSKIQTHSVHEVFKTPELLEVILLNLPTFNLLKCEQVSKGFQATMMGSTAIQKALFMAPPSKSGTPAKKDQLPQINNLLEGRGHWSRCLYRVRDLEFEISYGGPTFSTGQSKPMVVLEISQYSCSGRRAVQVDPVTGSWNKMYLTQPPCDISVHTACDDRERHVKAMPFGKLLRMLADEHHAEVAVEDD